MCVYGESVFRERGKVCVGERMCVCVCVCGGNACIVREGVCIWRECVYVKKEGVCGTSTCEERVCK